jgi:hypothetical protein
MNDDREQRIRERAHQIWEREGRPDGQEQSHWERASREISEEDRTRAGTIQEEDPSRSRASDVSGTERLPGEPKTKGASSPRTGIHDPKNAADASSEGKSRA